MKYFVDNFTLVSKEYLVQIFNLISKGENITSLWVPGIGRTAFADEMQKKSLPESFYKSFPSLSLNKIIFPVLDLSLSETYFLKQLEEVLELYSDKSGIRRMISDICENGTRIVFMLDNFEFKKNVETIKYIYSLKNVDTEMISFFILALESDFYSIEDAKSKDSIMSHNIIQIPYFSQDEAFEWLSINQKKHGVKLTNSQYNEIIQFSGGISLFMRVLLRGLGNKKTVEEIINSKEMKDSIETFISHFSKTEQNIIRRLFITNTLPPYKFEVDYLRKHGLIDMNNKLIGLWGQIHFEDDVLKKIEVTEDSIVWEGYDLMEKLTSNELKILRILIREYSLNNYVSKELVAEEIWGKESFDKFSLWALDKIISRMRRKLDVIGIGGGIIKTKRNKGYKLSGVEFKN